MYVVCRGGGGGGVLRTLKALVLAGLVVSVEVCARVCAHMCAHMHTRIRACTHTHYTHTHTHTHTHTVRAYCQFCGDSRVRSVGG